MQLPTYLVLALAGIVAVSAMPSGSIPGDLADTHLSRIEARSPVTRTKNIYTYLCCHGSGGSHAGSTSSSRTKSSSSSRGRKNILSLICCLGSGHHRQSDTASTSSTRSKASTSSRSQKGKQTQEEQPAAPRYNEHGMYYFGPTEYVPVSPDAFLTPAERNEKALRNAGPAPTWLDYARPEGHRVEGPDGVKLIGNDIMDGRAWGTHVSLSR